MEEMYRYFVLLHSLANWKFEDVTDEQMKEVNIGSICSNTEIRGSKDT